jgi:hypothetical protein
MAHALTHMTAGLQFTRQNDGWNAEPNIATPQLTLDGGDLLLAFPLNHLVFKVFDRSDVGVLRFANCSRYRVDGTNDEAWYGGACRYSCLAPAWGEFYEISGPIRRSLASTIGAKLKARQHQTFPVLFP